MPTRPRYRAAVMTAPHAPIVLQDFPSPDLAPGAALLHVEYSEVCGTDVHLHHGRLAGVPYPIIPGHVSVGVLAAMNGRLTDIDGEAFHEGDRVTFLDVHETCGACYHCLVTRQSTRCPHRKVYGITYSANDGLLGGWSEAIWLKPGVKLLRLPNALDVDALVGGGCGLMTALHAVDRAELRLDQTVAILGVGPVGQSAVALSALSGASEIVAVGAPADRLALATRMGATMTLSLDTPADERTALVRERTRGRGVDTVIEASGSPAAVSQALDLVRDGGRVVICGHYTDNGPVTIHPHWQVNRKHVEIRGCWGSDYSHFHRAVDLVAHFATRYPWSALAARRFTLDQANEALAAVATQAVPKAVIVPNTAA